VSTGEEAILPGNISIFSSYRKMQERPEVKQKKSESEKIARLDRSESFRALRDVIDRRIADLRELRSITPNDSVEAVGFRYLASQIAIEYLEEIRDLPARKRKFLEKHENE
jgi:hypothetical protein